MRQIAAFLVLAIVLAPAPARAEDVRLLSSVAVKAVIDALTPEFERSTGHTVVPVFGIAAALKASIDEGAPFDVAILTPAMLDELAAKGLLQPTPRPIVARAGLGLMVKAGAPRPDVTSVAAFRRTLLDARAVAYVPDSASGVAFVATMETLGITAAVKARARAAASVDEVAASVLSGSADLAVLPVSEILPLRGAELGGVFPAEVQRYIVMSAGIGARSAHAAAARAFVDFLTAAKNTPVLRAHGMER